MGVGEIILVCFLWLVSRSPKFLPRLTLTDRVVFLFIAILLITSLFGIDPLHSFWGSLDRLTGGIMWLHLAAIFLVTRGLVRTQQDWHSLFTFSTTVALVIAIIHLLSLGGAQVIPEARGGSTFGNSSFLGGYLVLSAFLALFVATTSQGKQKRLFVLCAATVCAITVFTTNAIAAQFSLIGGVVLLSALLLITQQKKGKRTLGSSILIGLIVLFLSSTILVFQPENFFHKKFIELSSGARFVLWDMAWQGVLERPLLGWGLENFGYVSLKHHNPCLGTPSCGGEMWFDRAHNKLLDVWIESGLVGLIAYLAIFVTALMTLWRSSLREKRSPITAAVVTTALAAYFIQNLAILDMTTSLLFWLLLIAYMSHAGEPRSSSEPSTTPLHRTTIVVPLIVTLALPLSFYLFLIQPMRGNAALVRLATDNTVERRLRDYQIATTLSPLGIDMRRAFAANQTQQDLWQVPIEDFQNIASYAEAELAMAQKGLLQNIERRTNQLRLLISLGIIYHTHAHFLDQDSFRGAEAILAQAMKQYPNHPQPKWTLTSIYLDQGRGEEALALTQSVIDNGTVSALALNYKLLVLRWIGDMEAFEQTAQTALETFPNLQTQIDGLRNPELLDSETKRQTFLTLFH